MYTVLLSGIINVINVIIIRIKLNKTIYENLYSPYMVARYYKK